FHGEKLPERLSRQGIFERWLTRLGESTKDDNQLLFDLARILMESGRQEVELDLLYEDKRTAQELRRTDVAAPFNRLELREGVLMRVEGADTKEVAFAMDRYLEQAAGAALVADGKAESPVDLAAALDRKPDVVIDYTHPSSRMANVMAAVERRVPMVIGTTGFSSAEFEEIDRAARAAGIGLATGNFSLTAALLQHFAVIAAAHLPHYTVLEYCKAEKPDVPSGTARELAELMAEVRRPDYALSTGDHIGYPESLGAEIDGVRVHAVRLPGYSAGVEVLFGLQGERLALRHEMGADDSIFVEGSLLAARKVQGFQGLVRGLDKLIFDS
ncbi:MAG: 4-hydroxy-tetrahydrodipicolinate reductase, partial [Rhodospirillaceae bacterium]|nr:4-hydroxy-tetrahydrodipicolinate reductase [Rhodospirillaceae bacterium]